MNKVKLSKIALEKTQEKNKPEKQSENTKRKVETKETTEYKNTETTDKKSE